MAPSSVRLRRQSLLDTVIQRLADTAYGFVHGRDGLPFGSGDFLVIATYGVALLEHSPITVVEFFKTVRERVHPFRTVVIGLCLVRQGDSVEDRVIEKHLATALSLDIVLDLELCDSNRPAGEVCAGSKLGKLLPQHERSLLIDILGVGAILEHRENESEQFPVRFTYQPGK